MRASRLEACLWNRKAGRHISSVARDLSITSAEVTQHASSVNEELRRRGYQPIFEFTGPYLRPATGQLFADNVILLSKVKTEREYFFRNDSVAEGQFYADLLKDLLETAGFSNVWSVPVRQGDGGVDLVALRRILPGFLHLADAPRVVPFVFECKFRAATRVADIRAFGNVETIFSNPKLEEYTPFNFATYRPMLTPVRIFLAFECKRDKTRRNYQLNAGCYYLDRYDLAWWAHKSRRTFEIP